MSVDTKNLLWLALLFVVSAWIAIWPTRGYVEGFSRARGVEGIALSVILAVFIIVRRLRNGPPPP